jgi:hypothetical protein
MDAKFSSEIFLEFTRLHGVIHQKIIFIITETQIFLRFLNVGMCSEFFNLFYIWRLERKLTAAKKCIDRNINILLRNKHTFILLLSLQLFHKVFLHYLNIYIVNIQINCIVVVLRCCNI